MKKKQIPDIYFPKEFCIIQWNDASSYIGQLPIDSDFTISSTISIGWLIKETKDTYIIAASVSDLDVRFVLVIPKAIVINIQRFKTGGKKK